MDKQFKEDISEMDKSAPQPGRDGKISFRTYGSRDLDKPVTKEYQGKPMKRKDVVKTALKIFNKEDVAVNNVGGGNVAGLGVGPQGEPPKHKALLSKVKSMLKRKVPNVGTKSTS